MKTAYVGQSIANLRFALYDCALEPGLFRIFRKRCIEREDYRAEFWIIGSSHAINIQARGASISEVLTADESTLPSDGRIELIDEFERRRCTYEIADKLTYQTELELLSYSQEDFHRGRSDLFGGDKLFRLKHSFPLSEDVIAAPVTVIDVVRADEEGLEVKTFHSYVEDLAVVVTRSVLQVV